MICMEQHRGTFLNRHTGTQCSAHEKRHIENFNCVFIPVFCALSGGHFNPKQGYKIRHYISEHPGCFFNIQVAGRVFYCASKVGQIDASLSAATQPSIQPAMKYSVESIS